VYESHQSTHKPGTRMNQTHGCSLIRSAAGRRPPAAPPSGRGRRRRRPRRARPPHRAPRPR